MDVDRGGPSCLYLWWPRPPVDSLTERPQTAPVCRQKATPLSGDGPACARACHRPANWPFPHVKRHVTSKRRGDPAISSVAYRPPKMAIQAEAVVISDGIGTNYHSVDIAIEPTFLAALCSGFAVPGRPPTRRARHANRPISGRLSPTSVHANSGRVVLLWSDATRRRRYFRPDTNRPLKFICGATTHDKCHRSALPPFQSRMLPAMWL